MIIERINHATEEDLEIIISELSRNLFSVALRDADAKLNLPSVTLFKTKIAAQDYAEQLAGLIN